MNRHWLRMFPAATLLANFALLGMAACTHEGPLEKAGRHVDNAANEVKEGTKKAVNELKDK
jgi:hypothetical protein